jgi:exopolysaccharide production protein ExoQ
MPPKLALAAALFYIAWLFAGERKRGSPFSRAMWIPLIWLLILASRPISLWFPNAELTGNAIDGTPFDRNIFLGLMIAGLLVLVRRRVVLGAFLSNNKMLVIFFAYLGLSVLWSDFAFIAFRRWIKDLGNIIIVLVVLTEPDPMAAVRSLLVRCAYVLIPLSVVCIRYFPEIGRYLNRFNWTYSYGGVTLDKNYLGVASLLSSLGLFLRLLECRRCAIHTRFLLVLAGMNLWLYTIADCSTALVTTILSIIILSLLELKAVQERAERFGYCAFAAIALLLSAHFAFGLGEVLVGLVGRNLSLTGRTDIWRIVLNVGTNPLFGVGYRSFWMGNRVDWRGLGYTGDLLEAHNGYIETYINSGLIGVALLLTLLVGRLRHVSRSVRQENEFARLQFGVIVLTLIYNMTESIFNGFGPVWFIALIALVQYPQEAGSGLPRCARTVGTSGLDTERDFRTDSVCISRA